ncbi:FUSC family membrane protein [Flavobacterium sp.]|uniref:FUSC family protein n=1 Tax=Flavobacterium sp. TaxID=239 RepID=UPI0026360063|nr:FUSC family membrane protein [Flavobacterium sp.]MDD3003833.1 FUSC family membrane protein [Flavobacterium sp.]
MFKSVQKFTTHTNFTNALKITVAAVIPVIFFSFLDLFHVGFSFALGAVLTYPSDIPSNLKHKVNGILVALLIIASAAILVSVLHPYPFLFYPFFALGLFFLSIISVYGHRATMISFSGLLSMTLAFGHIQEGISILINTGYIVGGGLFYLLVSLIFYQIRPYRYVELQIADCLKLTSKYMKLRGDLWDNNAPRESIIKGQLLLQVELNTTHENLREILIRNRSTSGSSNQNRKMLFVFVSLVEILELALSTSFNHQKFNDQFSDFPKILKNYQNLAYNLAVTLKRISSSIVENKKYVSNHQLFSDLEILEQSIIEYQNSSTTKDAHEGVLMLSNMRDYVERQIDKVKVLERAFTESIEKQEAKFIEKDLEKFLTPLYYPWSTLQNNLSFSSTLFRHSLRLTITIFVAIIIGSLLSVEKVYWILLTIVVILRPGFGLTKNRTYERIFGTVLGGLIAFGIIAFTQNPFILSVFSIIAMLLGFTFTQTNYKVGATFVTIYVVFIYAMLTPNVQDVVQYRIMDTLLGAFLAFSANYLLWPSWEFLNVRVFLKKSIKANYDYLKEISEFYNKKGDVTTSYKVARKFAFIEIGNLMNSFQRMTQEPKSKQKQLPQLYKLVELNYSLVSSSASLGTYIQTHKTTKASEAFNVVVDTVLKNLNASMEILNSSSKSTDPTYQTEDLEVRFVELKNIRSKEIRENSVNEEDFQTKMQETQLVIEQLIWLTNLSESILKASQKLVQTDYNFLPK